MANLRFDVVAEAFRKRPLELVPPLERPSEYFARKVFNRQKMYKYLPSDVYEKLIDVIDNGAHLDRGIADAVAKGMNVTGPVPPDTVFSKMAGGMFDLVVVMYHDQGHIPIKLKGFTYDEETGQWGAVAGVNITLGLPIVRVSVDHGTAFEIAGQGKANPDSMLDSIELAAWLAKA